MQIPCARKGHILFCKKHSDSTTKFCETDIINMLEFLIDNIFVICGGRVFQQTVGIHLSTNCAPLPADLFLYSYEADFIQELLPLDDVLSLNIYRFGDFVDRIYPMELAIKDTTDRSVSYLDLHLQIVSEERLRTKVYDNRDDFNFSIVDFPFIDINIPTAPAYGLYIS